MDLQAFLYFFLSLLGYNVTAIDIDDEIVKFAKSNAKLLHSELVIKKWDIRDLRSLGEKFDLTFSGGVIEHYDEEEVCEILQQEAIVSKYVLIKIPNYRFLRNKLDEQPYTQRDMKRMCKKSGLKVLKIVGYGNPTKLSLIIPPIFQKKFQTLFGLYADMLAICESNMNLGDEHE